MADSSLYIHCQVILGCLLQTVHLHYQVIFGCLWQTFPFILASHTWLSVADSSNSIIKSYSVVYGNKSVTQPSLIGLSIPDSPCYTVKSNQVLNYRQFLITIRHTQFSIADSFFYNVKPYSAVYCRQLLLHSPVSLGCLLRTDLYTLSKPC